MNWKQPSTPFGLVEEIRDDTVIINKDRYEDEYHNTIVILNIDKYFQRICFLTSCFSWTILIAIKWTTFHKSFSPILS